MQKLPICAVFGSLLRSRCLQSRRGWRKHRHNVCGADRRPSRFTSTRRWSPGIFCPGIGCVTGLHTLSPWAPAPSSSVCPVSRLSSRALRARTLVFTFCLRRQLTAPRGLAPRLELSRLTLARPSRPPGGGASTSQGHPRTIFQRALEHDNLVLTSPRRETPAARSASAYMSRVREGRSSARSFPRSLPAHRRRRRRTKGTRSSPSRLLNETKSICAGPAPRGAVAASA